MIEPLFQAARIERVSPLVYLRLMLRLGLPAVAKRLESLDPSLATSLLGKDLSVVHFEKDQTIFGIWSTLQSSLSPFLTETLVRCFVRSDVTAAMLLRGERPAILYLRLQEGHLERLSPFIRLVVETLVKDMLVCWEQSLGVGCRKVFFDLEEAGIAALPNLNKYVSAGRSKGFIFQLFYQSVSQIENNYGREKAQTIMENMETTLFLKPNPIHTAHEIEDWLGKGSQYSHSHHYRQGSEASLGLAEQAIPVMSARQIMEMDEKFALIFYSTFKPMKAHRLKWWQSPLLRARHGLPVPALAALPTIPDLPQSKSSQANTEGVDEDSSLFACVNPDAINISRAKQVSLTVYERKRGR